MSVLSDAQYASADPSVSVKKTSVKDFILALYSPFDVSESDFIFDPATARDLMTGKSTSGQGSPTSVDLEPMKIDAAKVQSNETIYAAADRHLRRHGLIHWDSPDGKIVVGYPNDTQDPQYFFRYLRGTNGAENNILGCTRTMDYSGIPSSIVMHGKTKGKPRRKIKATVEDSDVIAGGFYRPVVLPDEGLRVQEHLDRATAREMSNRRRRKDAYNIEIDGLSWWDGYENIPIAIDSVCNMNSDLAGVEGGAYYIFRVVHRRDARSGDTTNITALKRGLWVL
jgi:prophage tail gpP-like protein